MVPASTRRCNPSQRLMVKSLRRPLKDTGEHRNDMAAPTQFEAELARIAREENLTLGALRRGDQELEERIDRYCHEVGIPATAPVKAHYSAVFISWCVRTAGASETEFPSAAAHWQ